MQRPNSTLPLFEEDGNVTIESFNLEKVAKGEIQFAWKKDGVKPSKEKINLKHLLSTNHMHHIPADDLITYFIAIEKIRQKYLDGNDIKRYEACLKKFLQACVSKIDREIVASAHGLLAHLQTLYNKYDMATSTKKKKRVLVLYMNNPERWGEKKPLDLDMYKLSKVVAEKKRANGHDVTVANLSYPEDIPELLEKLGKKKFSDVCLVGHSLRYNYQNFDPPFDKPAPLQHVACHHIGGFTIEDCADLLYQLSIKNGVSTVKSFACESGIMAKRLLPAEDDVKYDDQGEVPHDLNLLSEEPSIIQLTLAHIALLAQMDKCAGKLNLLAIAPNGIAYIDVNNQYKFRIIDPKNYFRQKFVAKEDRVPRTKNRLTFFPEDTSADALQERADRARHKLEHKLETLREKLDQAKDGDVIRLIKREINSLEHLLESRAPAKKEQPDVSK